METEDAVCLMTSIALIVLSIQYRRGRWLCSIAGYDVTKRESEIDIRPYAKLISSVTLWMGLLFFLWAVEDWVRDCFGSTSVQLGLFVVRAARSVCVYEAVASGSGWTTKWTNAANCQ